MARQGSNRQISMARRFSAPYQSEPVSSLATWARNLAVFSVGRGAGLDPHRPLRFPRNEAGAGDVLRRAGDRRAVDPGGFAAFAAIWQNGSRGMGRILLALLINVPCSPIPPISPCNTASCRRSTTSPPIRSTRRASRRWRGCAAGEGANSAVYAGLYSAEQQRVAYPDIETVELEVPAQRAYEMTLRLVNRRKWLVIDERRRSRRAASAVSRRWRERRSWDSARTSRSASRPMARTRASISAPRRAISSSDLGSNAARVAKLIEDINTAADNAKPSGGEEAAGAGQGAGEDGEEVIGRMANGE